MEIEPMFRGDLLASLEFNQFGQLRLKRSSGLTREIGISLHLQPLMLDMTLTCK
jgi:hypothetical protein